MMTEKEFNKTIAANLKRIAYEHNKSQAQIARDLGIGQSTVACWMNGSRTPRMKYVDMLCRYFNCKRSDILEPYTPKPIETISAFERNMVFAYRAAPASIQESVLILLGMKERE